MIIGIDIDDTLTFLQDTKIKTAQNYIKKHNLPYKIVNPDALFFKDMVNWTEEECDTFWISEADEMLAKVPARKNASKVITNLKQNGHKIVIITARSSQWHKDPYQMSYDWLVKNNIPFDKIIVGHIDKTQVCIDEKLDVFIDDIPLPLVKLQPHNIKTILMSTPHNKNQDIYNGCIANNWLDVENMLLYNQ